MVRNPELRIWFQPVNGEGLAVASREFGTLEEALETLTAALERGRTMRFDLDGDDLETGGGGVALVNLANVVAVKVWQEPAEGAPAGQHL